MAQVKSGLAKKAVGIVVLFAMVGAAVLCILDSRLKSNGLLYSPPSAYWYAHTSDLPSLLETSFRHPQSNGATTEFERLIQNEFANFFQETGLSTTASGWRRWFGDEVVAWGEENEWALCVRPGVIAHVSDFKDGEDTQNGIRRVGEIYYAWRSGCLVVSPYQSYLSSNLKTLEQLLHESNDTSSVQIWWGASDSLDSNTLSNIRIHAPSDLQNDWAFSGELTSSFSTTPVPVIPEWGTDPLIEIHGGSLQDWIDLAAETPLHQIKEWIPEQLASEWGGLWERWSLAPEIFEYLLETETASGALLNVDTHGTLPVPVFTLAYPAPGTPPPFPPVNESLPHAWNGTDGCIWPFLGNAVLFAAAEAHQHFFITSQEPMMARLLDAQENEKVNELEGWMLEADLSNLSRKVYQIATKLAELQLVQGKNRKDIEELLSPVVRSVEGIGTLHLEMEQNGEGLKVSGYLSTQEAAV